MTPTVQPSAIPPGRRGRRRPLRRRGLECAIVLVALSLASSGAASAMPTATPSTSSPVSAENQIFTWGIEPLQAKDKPYRATFAYDVTPGQVLRDTVRVKNFSGGPLNLAVYATDAINSDTGALDLRAAADKPTDSGTWISLEKRTLRVETNGEADVPFTIKIPATGVEPGDHVGGIVTSLLLDPARDAAAPVKLDRRVGTAVQLRVAGPLNPKLAITDLKTSYGNAISPIGRGSVSTTYTVTNVGNVRVGADQVIEVKGPIGFPVSTFRPEAIAELLPGNSVSMSYKVHGVWPMFRAKTIVTLTAVPKRPRETFNTSAAGARASTSDWTLPWATVVALILLFFARKIYRARKRREAVETARQLEGILDARGYGTDANEGSAAIGIDSGESAQQVNGDANSHTSRHTNGHAPVRSEPGLTK